MILKPGMLIEVAKSHMGITTNVGVVGLELGELLLIVTAENDWQAVALRINTGEFIHITSLDGVFETPAYVEAIR